MSFVQEGDTTPQARQRVRAEMYQSQSTVAMKSALVVFPLSILAYICFQNYLRVE